MNNPFSELSQRLDRIESRLNQISDSKQPEFVSLPQACEILNLSKSAMYKKTCRKEIDFYKHGKKLFFRRTDLIDYIAKNKQREQATGLRVEK